MASAELDLGAVDLSSTDPAMQLKITSHAKIASSEKDVAEQLTYAALTSTTAENPWTTLGNGLRLTIDLSTDDQIGDEQRHALLEAAAQSLHDAEFWSQLCIRPVSVRCYTAQVHTIVIELTYSENVEEHTKIPLLKLTHGAPHHAIQPPIGVASIHLESVHLTLHLTTRNERKGQGIDSSRPLSRLTISLETFLDLFDAGIRSVVALSPKAIARGVRICGKESLRPLAEVFPQLWSPGHLAAHSNRAILLPSISRAISNVGVRYGRRETLQYKIGELVRRQGSQKAKWSVSEDSLERPEAQTVIAAQLWRMTQRSLFDADAANRLKSLSKLDNHESVAKDERYEILDIASSPTELQELDDQDSSNAGTASECSGSNIWGDETLHAQSSEATALDEAELALSDTMNAACATQLEHDPCDDDLLSICGSVMSLATVDSQENSKFSSIDPYLHRASQRQGFEMEEMLET